MKCYVLPVHLGQRGSTAIEFALVAPALLVMLMAIFDYGWFFFQESLVTNALQQGLRIGALQAPDAGDAEGECSTCTSVAATAIATELASLGITVTTTEVTPRVQGIADTCALVLQSSITHDALTGLIPMPQTYNIRVVAFAQAVSGC